ncbi:TIGR02453 family protein [Lentimicrobium saccharophilum]|uniref:TIGR02453 family protein n=1 Tax=Lentimicrobium saccharophilum TaxID=1678841 RepID=A0A0S7C080_9BACT|nr:DUF2461 domain-containing protein [Lentimicrobium saccharophilum]GAP42544.1 TIGR02453 family protein [Lentimicrobium saccharophilum]
MKHIIEFLTDLGSNNNRDWFEKNKPVYNKVKADFETFINGLIADILLFDPSLGGLQAKDCTFRIYRDVRFSHDKSPYKTNIGAFMARGGRKSTGSGYYLHLEPGKSFVGGGIYMPGPEVLKRIRQEIYFNPGAFRSIIEEREFKRIFGKLSEEDKLKRPPRDFPADYPDMDLLMYKSYVCGHSISDQDIVSSGFTGKVTEAFRAMKDLNHFLNNAVEAGSH